MTSYGGGNNLLVTSPTCHQLGIQHLSTTPQQQQDRKTATTTTTNTNSDDCTSTTTRSPVVAAAVRNIEHRLLMTLNCLYFYKILAPLMIDFSSNLIAKLDFYLYSSDDLTRT